MVEESLKDEIKNASREKKEELLLRRIREIWDSDEVFVQYVHATEG